MGENAILRICSPLGQYGAAMMAGASAAGSLWLWSAAAMIGLCAWWGMGLARWAQAYDGSLRAGAPVTAKTLWQAARHARRQPVRWLRDGAGGLAAAALGACVWRLQGGDGLGVLLLGLGLMALACLDQRSGLLPDALTLPLMGAGWCFGPLDLWTAAGASLSLWAGLAAGAGLYRRWRGRDGFGGGDVKCLAMLAGWFGAAAALTILWMASLLGLLAWACRRSRRQAYPFGPYLALAAGPWLVWPAGATRLLDGLIGW